MRKGLGVPSAIGALLLTSTIWTQPASAQQTCDSLREHLERSFCSRSRLSDQTAAGCEAVEQIAEDVCEDLDFVRATKGAESIALDLLRQDFDVIEAESTLETSFVPHHVVIGPAELEDEEIQGLLQNAYASGRTVAIVESTQAQADTFHDLIVGGRASCKAGSDRSKVALYGVQRVVTGEQQSSYCLPSLDGLDDDTIRGWYREVAFGIRPPQPRASEQDETDPMGWLLLEELYGLLLPPAHAQSSDPSLTQLAVSTNCNLLTTYGTEEQGGGIAVGVTDQDSIFVYGLRDFTSQQDFYQVAIEEEYSIVKIDGDAEPCDQCLLGMPVNRPGEADPGGFDPNTNDLVPGDLKGTILLFPKPDTATSYVTQTSSNKTTTVSGDVGFTGAKPTVKIGESVTVGTSKTVSVPPVRIDNRANLSNAQPGWEFTPQNIPFGDLFDPLMSWFWQVPRSAYPKGGEDSTGPGHIQFQYSSGVFGPQQFPDGGVCTVPYPYPSWDPNSATG